MVLARVWLASRNEGAAIGPSPASPTQRFYWTWVQGVRVAWHDVHRTRRHQPDSTDRDATVGHEAVQNVNIWTTLHHTDGKSRAYSTLLLLCFDCLEASAGPPGHRNLKNSRFADGVDRK